MQYQTRNKKASGVRREDSRIYKHKKFEDECRKQTKEN